MRILIHGTQVEIPARPHHRVQRAEGSGPRRADPRDQAQHPRCTRHITQAKDANEVWRILKEDHYFWYNADKVLSLCKIDETKVFMLVLLEEAIKVLLPSLSKSGWPYLWDSASPSRATSWTLCCSTLRWRTCRSHFRIFYQNVIAY